MKRYFAIGVLALAVATGVACGEPAPLTELAVASTATPTFTPTPTQTTMPTSAPTPTSILTLTSPPVLKRTPAPPPLLIPTPAPDIISSLQDVKRATVQIEAEGSFVDLDLGEQLNRRGRGSGFIIDESGIAVTNNHVVTGAAILRVWVGGEREPRNAKILGVSECSDLAVIDIDGAGYPFFQWFEGEITPGLDVFAAGFPLGDPEFTLTRGIISKARAMGETNWASVDSVVQHDATINPGNSGGPLVTPDGRLVGVNYAGADQVDQYFAIARDEALKVINRLKAGQDVNSIGVNGTAVVSSDGTLSGVWVASVASGTPASNVGLKGGDLITRLEGLVLSRDGTKADYCDVLRTHEPDDVLSIQVLRFDTGEVLEGKLNSYQLEPEDSAGTTPQPASAPGYTFATATDDTGALAIEIPREWSDFDGGLWREVGQTVGASISASPDLDGFFDSFSTPGVLFIASRIWAETFDEAGLLDSMEFGEKCTFQQRSDFDSGAFQGFQDLYTDCKGGGGLVVLAAAPQERPFTALVLAKVVSEADAEAWSRIRQSFDVIGPLP